MIVVFLDIDGVLNQPLAALAHLCDVTSARLWFDHPAPADDPGEGAKRTSEPRRTL